MAASSISFFRTKWASFKLAYLFALTLSFKIIFISTTSSIYKCFAKSRFFIIIPPVIPRFTRTRFRILFTKFFFAASIFFFRTKWTRIFWATICTKSKFILIYNVIPFRIYFGRAPSFRGIFLVNWATCEYKSWFLDSWKKI